MVCGCGFVVYRLIIIPTLVSTSTSTLTRVWQFVPINLLLPGLRQLLLGSHHGPGLAEVLPAPPFEGVLVHLVGPAGRGEYFTSNGGTFPR